MKNRVNWQSVVVGRLPLLALMLLMSITLAGYSQTSLPEVEMVFVPSGEFTMGCTFEQGSECAYDERPAHKVTLRAYAIAKYPVTQALWKAVMGSNPSRFKGDDLPVESVSWDEVQMFIKRLNQLTGLNYRLPTEAEWEFAARGGLNPNPTRFCGGAELPEYGWYFNNAENTTHPVGLKRPNTLGIYDMSGNVWEWCSDYYGKYPDDDVENPTGPSKGSARVLRGGAFSTLDKQCRVTSRKSLYQAGKDFSTGFRLAMDDDREAIEQAARERAEREAAEAAERAEKERMAAQEAAEKAEREAKEAAERAEQERLAAEKAAKEAAEKAEREAKEAAEKAEREAKEAAERAEQARLDSIENVRRAEIAAEKAAAHQLKVDKRDARMSSIPRSLFLTLNGEMMSFSQYGVGFKIGTMKNVGWYLSVMTSPSFHYKGMSDDFEEEAIYELSGKSKTAYVEALIGLTARRYKAVSFHFGAGYAYRTNCIETQDGWLRYEKSTYMGPVVATGLMFHFGPVVLSTEGVAMFNVFSPSGSGIKIGGKLGLGFCIPTKKNN